MRNRDELNRRNKAFARLRAIVTVEVRDGRRYAEATADLDTLERLLPVESFLGVEEESR